MTRWFRGAAELFIAITTAVRQAQDDNPRDPVAALKAAQATLPDSAADLSAFFSTAESKVPEEFHTLRREIERMYLMSSNQEIDEDAAFALLFSLVNKGALATLAATPPY
jgi:hypothetical protein